MLHPSATPRPFPPLDPLDVTWDPAEELAHLLAETFPPAESTDTPPVDDSLAGLAQITAELPPVRSAGPGHRRAPARKPVLNLLQTTSFLIAAVAAVIVSMVSVFGGMVTYDPLRHIAEPRTPYDAARWWPLLVYGPWMVASLSILRAALHQRRAVHSWAVVLLFSTVAMLLCVAEAPRTFTDAAAAALPSLAALACFQQLVRQITLTRPPRQSNPRHRNPAPPAGGLRPAKTAAGGTAPPAAENGSGPHGSTYRGAP
ncbi:DUF2637 domain-containing protein [Streptomyces sp. NPDC050856]|uniref:DUF2637 domain-containing protein n=1 Tax=Streptomyces sp. NPDC050856 TaxID=3154939 RepID=UPI0033DF5038